MAKSNTANQTKKFRLATFIVSKGAKGATRDEIAKFLEIEPSTVPVHMWALRQAGMNFKDTSKGSKKGELKPYVAVGGVPASIKETRGTGQPKVPAGKRAAKAAQKAAKSANTAPTSTGDKKLDKAIQNVTVVAEKAVSAIESAVEGVKVAARRH